MAVHKYLREFWNSDESKELMRKRMIEWRKQDATVRVEHPIRLDRARSVGYKAKQGYVVVRQRVIRGGRKRQKQKAGRRSKNTRRKKILSKNYRQVAEGRAQAKYQNLMVLNSYQLCKDHKYHYFEVILVDPEHPNIKNDENLANLATKNGRVERGLTQSGKRARGQKGKGKGREKVRPSLNAKKGRGN